MFKVIVSVIGAIILLLALTFGLNYFGLAQFAFFAPKVAAVQNEVFHNSQAYTDGMANDLGDLQVQYFAAKDQGSKDAIAALVRQRYSGYDKSKLPSELRDFYFQVTTQ